MDTVLLEHWRVESPHRVIVVCPGTAVQEEVAI